MGKEERWGNLQGNGTERRGFHARQALHKARILGPEFVLAYVFVVLLGLCLLIFLLDKTPSQGCK